MMKPLYNVNLQTGMLNNNTIFNNDIYGLIIEDKNGKRATYLPNVFKNKNWKFIKNKLIIKSGSNNDNNPSGSVPTYLYLKNITGSGFSGSAGGPTTASVLHVFVSASGGQDGPHTGSFDVAKVYQGGFAYIPINPNVSYYAYSPTGSGAAGLTGTIIEYGVFR